MDYTAAPLEKLIEEFGKFQGVGRKGATRMAYQVLSMSDKDAAALADAIRGAHTRLHRCRICQNFTALLENSKASKIKEDVMSPKGTTAAGLFELESNAVRASFMKAVEAAYIKASKV
jgi:pyrroline-5-carboxylate reductase